MDINPKVSIVIPVYNGSNYLRDAIDSALAQTYTNFEVIVINDGSDDGGKTDAIAHSFENKIRYFLKKNGGVASALNLGIRQMTGQYFTWLSHDDLWLPQKLEQQIKFLLDNNLKICYSDYILIDEKGEKIRQITSPDNCQIEALFGSETINGVSIIIDKECFSSCGIFSETRIYTQDIDMWLRLCLKYKMGKIDEPLVLYRTHSGQGSKKYKKAMLSEEKSMYIEFVKNLNFSELYPDKCRGMEKKIINSSKYFWFGNLMFEERRWHLFGLLQFINSFRIWLSLKNPSIGTFVFKTIKLFYIMIFGGTFFFINSLIKFYYRSINHLLKKSKSP